mgnify:CR=1 FL=1
MEYFLDIYLFSPEDIALNAAVLLWPKKINPIFDEHDDVRIFSLFVVYFDLLEFSLLFILSVDNCI